MIDSHVHLHRDDFADDRDDAVARAVAAGVTGFLNVGYDLPSSREAVALAAARPRFLATVGIHPHDAAELAGPDGEPRPDAPGILDELRALAGRPEVVAIGEIGLDFFRDLSPRPAQHTALRLQLDLAKELDLPVVFHIRDAYPETLALVDEVGLPPRRAVLHSFAGAADHARWARERGCLLGIGGPVTYRKSHLPAVLAEAEVRPGEVLLETDCPWLPPTPHRGKRNEPAWLVHTRDVLADLLQVAPAALDEATDANFAALFGRMPGSA